MANKGPSCAFTDFCNLESFHIKTFPSLPPEKLMSAAFPNATHSMSHDFDTLPNVPRVDVNPPPEKRNHKYIINKITSQVIIKFTLLLENIMNVS